MKAGGEVVGEMKEGAKPEKLGGMTIGSVCESLRTEFPDISESKLRYLENQKLLAPHRTPGGYRIYTASDVSRLRAILRTQRDKFMPLDVIRRELAAGRIKVEAPRKEGPPRSGSEGYTLSELLERSGAEAGLVRELEEYGVIKGIKSEGGPYYDATDLEIVRAVTELARYGVAGRNLRIFRSSAGREAALLEQILAPSLRSDNSRRRKQAVETLESLAEVTARLKRLLLIRDLKKLTRAKP